MSSGASAWPGGSPVAGWAWPSRPRLSLKDRAASIPRASPQFLFDSEQPVVLGRAVGPGQRARLDLAGVQAHGQVRDRDVLRDRKSTRLNSSHGYISYAVFCLKKKKLNPRTSQVS